MSGKYWDPAHVLTWAGGKGVSSMCWWESVPYQYVVTIMTNKVLKATKSLLAKSTCEVVASRSWAEMLDWPYRHCSG